MLYLQVVRVVDSVNIVQMSKSLTDSVEDYIWGRVPEAEYLKKVVEEKHVDVDSLSSKVRSIQSDLHVQLRKGVEENYPMLLDQVGAIESLDRMQASFDGEMRNVDHKAQEVKKFFANGFAQLKSNSIRLEGLVRLHRTICEARRCEELLQLWEKEQFDSLTRAECVAELKLLVAENPNFQLVPWIKDGFLKKVPMVYTETYQATISDLKQSLLALSGPSVNNCLKALSLLFDNEGCAKETRAIMDEAVQSLDAQFLNLAGKIPGDVANRQLSRIGNKLHTYLEQFQLLGVDNALYFSNKVAAVIRSRMPSDPESVVRLVQTVSKCLLPHVEPLVKPIKDALGPLKTAILSQSLAKMFDLVNTTFTENNDMGVVIVDKLNAAMKLEIGNFSWDVELQKQMESNIAKTLQIVASKVEELLNVSPEVLRLSGRVSKAQAQNYQFLTAAHILRKQWPLYSDCLRHLIDSQLKVILNTMQETVSLVLESMHAEDLEKELGPQAPCSLYMGELCDHLKVFRTHINQIEPLADSLEALPGFINTVVEQFFLQATAVNSFDANVRTRLIKDFTALCRSLQTLNCKSSKYLNLQKQLVDLLEGVQVRPSKQVPHWLVVHIRALQLGIPRPFQSAGWTRKEYMDWFNTHSDADRCNFLLNMIKAFEHSVQHVEPEVIALRCSLEEVVEDAP